MLSDLAKESNWCGAKTTQKHFRCGAARVDDDHQSVPLELTPCRRTVRNATEVVTSLAPCCCCWQKRVSGSGVSLDRMQRCPTCSGSTRGCVSHPRWERGGHFRGRVERILTTAEFADLQVFNENAVDMSLATIGRQPWVDQFLRVVGNP